jgi:ATP-dependent Clp endopeptidase proteolytic subunit ClpP
MMKYKMFAEKKEEVEEEEEKGVDDAGAEENVVAEEIVNVEDLSFLMNLGNSMNENAPKIRATGIYGDINEEKCSEVIHSMLMLEQSGKTLHSEDPEDPESELLEEYEPFDFYLSTFGGSALDMFAVYDVMRRVRETTQIRTIGIGKVMSAGTLLLAAGTKGERQIGKYCRVMIHGVIAGQSGHLLDIENEFEESKLTQKLYIDALSEETSMTPRYIKNLIKKKTNVYLSAQEAVDLGIADIIV